MKSEATLKVLVLFTIIAISLIPTTQMTFAGAPGSGWKPDVVVAQATSPLETDVNPSLATDSQGNLYNAKEIWDATAGRWKIKLHISKDQGATWLWAATFGEAAYHSISPSLAIDPATDTIYLAYHRYSIWHSDDRVYLWVKRPGAAWSRYLVTSNGYNPSLTCEYQYPTNYLYVSYNRWSGDLNNLDLLVARSTDGGVTWEEKVARGATDTHVYGQAKTTNAEGYVYIAYVHSEYHPVGADGHIDVTSFYRGSWGVSTAWRHSEDVSMVENDVFYPSIASTHGGGRVLVAYEYKSDDGDLDVLYAFSRDRGVTWAGGTSWYIAHSSADEKMPAVSVDGMGSTSQVYGNFHLIYTKQETVGKRQNGVYYTQIPYWGFPSYYEVIQLGCWPMPWSSPHGQIIDNDGYASLSYYSSITTYQRTVGGEDLWMPGVAWTDYRGDGVTRYYDVYYSTIDAEFKISFFPSSQTVVAGDSLKYYVTVTRLGGATAQAIVRARECYSCITTEMIPSTVTPTATSTLTIHTSNLLAPGGYSVYATATIGGYRRIVTVPFTLTAPPKLTLEISPTTVARGQPLTISGQLTPAPGAPTTIYLYYRSPHATGPWKQATTLTTDAAGAYSRTVTVPMGLTPADYDLVAFWVNLDDGSYARSPIVVLTIT